MRILGIESSCDETGVALVETAAPGAPPSLPPRLPRLLAHALHSQIEMHQAYGGVVPELASRDHIRRVLPLTTQVLNEAGCQLNDVDVVAYTRGPGLAGA
jgi:N6-L-threonylcarbamoyladenine synthase